MSGEYLGFVFSAYAASALAIAGLVLWVVLDARAQRRALVRLEERGVTRRSARERGSAAAGGTP